VGKLQRLLNAAARLITATRKFDHGLSRLLHDELHWLDIASATRHATRVTGRGRTFAERVHYKLGVTVHRCLHDKAPKYLVDCCTLVSGIASRHLRSASRHQLTVPRHRLSTLGRRAFFVAGPTVWNSLPDSLRDPALISDRFRQLLKTNLFRRYH